MKQSFTNIVSTPNRPSPATRPANGVRFTLSARPARGFFLRGHLRHGGTPVDSKQAAGLFADGDFATFKDRVAASNGNFALAVRKDNELWAAADRLRSYPLFYGQNDGQLFVSDDAYWVRGMVGDRRPAPEACTELWYLLYVLGDRTLSPGVRQLPAGEVLRARHGPAGLDVHTEPYYYFLHDGHGQRDDEPALLAALDTATVRAFERLLETTAGRQLVVPLSGGIDSRLTVCMLKRLGRSNVLAFWIGLPGNRESAISRYVAESLGYPWAFISYRDVDWNTAERQAARKRFYRFCANLCALPPVSEDWLAIEVLKRQGRLADDAIFCPGHLAGFSWSPRVTDSLCGLTDIPGLVHVVLDQNSPRLHWQRPEKEALGNIQQHVAEALETMRGARPEEGWDPTDLFYCWNWKERQCKRTVNMVRSYEYWGYDWRLPLWDSELADFWQRLPIARQHGRPLYRQYLSRYSDEHFFGLFDMAAPRFRPYCDSGNTLVRFVHRAMRHHSLSRYFVTDKNLERVLSGGYLRYLARVGRRVLSLEPVTDPWLLLEQYGLDDIWNAAD